MKKCVSLNHFLCTLLHFFTNYGEYYLEYYFFLFMYETDQTAVANICLHSVKYFTIKYFSLSQSELLLLSTM